MRLSPYIVLALLTTSCSSVASHQITAAEVASTQDLVQLPGTPFRGYCTFFESHDFGRIVASALKGRAWLGTEEGSMPLEGLQVAARELYTGKIRYVATGPDGDFEVPSLPVGSHEVWTCLDGFDELRFVLEVEPQSAVTELDLYVAPSETLGISDIIQIREEMHLGP